MSLLSLATILRCASIGSALVVGASLRAELIPASRLTDWTPGVNVGVPGGIPTTRTHLINVTSAPYNADKTGAADATAAIQAAVNAAVSGDVVYLPAGTYRLNSTLVMNSTRSGITLRGDGDSTVIDNHAASTGISVGSNSDYNWSWPASGNTITAGLTKGSTQITIADTSNFSVGQMVRIRLKNDPNIPVMSVVGYEGLRRQITRVTAKTATTLSVFPPIYGDYYSSGALVHVAQFQANYIGIEDLLIDSTNSPATFTIWFEQCYGSWLKNVHVKYSSNYHVFLNDSLNCEVRHCNLEQLKSIGTNGSGLLCNTISGCLVEDNIITKAFPLIEVNHGSSGNVFAYNFLYDSGPGVAINANHGPHNSFNLYEGNISPNLQADGYFGSVSDDTLFRNWLHGHQPGMTTGGWCISLNRFTRNYSIVGNIIGMAGYTLASDGTSFGNPNMGNSAYTGTAPPWTDGWVNGSGTLSQSGADVSTSSAMFNAGHVGQFIMTPSNSVVSLITAYVDSQHVTVNSSQTLTNLAYIVTPGSAGFQGLDTGVKAATLQKGNYYTFGSAIPSAEDIGTDVMPISLYRSSKPSWFGALAWPAIDPTAPNPSYESIPAGYRYVHGSDPVTDPTQQPQQQKPINVRVQAANQ